MVIACPVTRYNRDPFAYSPSFLMSETRPTIMYGLSGAPFVTSGNTLIRTRSLALIILSHFSLAEITNENAGLSSDIEFFTLKESNASSNDFWDICFWVSYFSKYGVFCVMSSISNVGYLLTMVVI
ncbi:hypothetical protein BC01_217 [Bacillus phage BC01]|nr:hypothetical protein BC01_217 [Bacillus phage BC01]